MTVTLTQLLPHVVTFGLVLLRASGLVLLVPIIGGDALPARLRGAVAALLAVILTPTVGPTPMSQPVELVLAGAGELIIGLAMGLVVRLVLLTAEMAGEVAGMQMGFAFNRVVDPLTREPVAITSRVMGTMTLLLLIAIDGHHAIIAELSASLQHAPLGQMLPQASTYIATLLPLLSIVVSAGLRIAAPMVAALLLTNVAVALLSRAAPQLNLFIFAFGLTIGIGILVLTSSVGPSLTLMLGQLQLLPTYISAVWGS